jgi:hypothetical protein
VVYKDTKRIARIRNHLECKCTHCLIHQLGLGWSLNNNWYPGRRHAVDHPIYMNWQDGYCLWVDYNGPVFQLSKWNLVTLVWKIAGAEPRSILYVFLPVFIKFQLRNESVRKEIALAAKRYGVRSMMLAGVITDRSRRFAKSHGLNHREEGGARSRRGGREWRDPYSLNRISVRRSPQRNHNDCEEV